MELFPQEAMHAFKNRFFRSRTLNWVYLFLMVVILAGIAISMIRSVAFLAENFNEILFISDAEVDSGVPSFDRAALAHFSGRLGIQIPTDTAGLPVGAGGMPNEEATSSPVVPAEKPVDLTAVKLEILNGTTIPGLAKIWKGYFLLAGFGEIAVGNAKTHDHQGFSIEYSEAGEAALPTVRDVIVKNGGTISQETKNDAVAGVTITVGK